MIALRIVPALGKDSAVSSEFILSNLSVLRPCNDSHEPALLQQF